MSELAKSILKRNPRVTYKELADGSGAVVLHLDSGDYHGLNQIGVLIWNLLEESRSVDSLVAGVRDEIEDAPPNLSEDVESFVSHLLERDLVILE